jgi:hypothetical protein
LLSTKAKRKRLAESIEQAEKGELRNFNLDEDSAQEIKLSV